jgi:TetR/AcrR family transcriptional repressor of bet genes
MRTLKKKVPVARIPRARDAHSRQRQRLIDACISALHIYGPSRTTVEKVVAIAKMSPGIVRFYFASKAAMLIASLQFLASEFEEQLLVPVARLKSRPVAALELMVELYLDPDIASPRKVSVWYAFWGEASSRQEYYDICGQKDESFARLVRQLIEALIEETSQPQLDPDGIALGLIGVLEILWQDFAFRSEQDIDRVAAKQRCMAYLRSIFPGQFAPPVPFPTAESHVAVPAARPAGWVYGNARLAALERELLFRDAWQVIGHAAQVPQPGDFLSVDLGFERALVVRDTAGDLRAFRNICSETPHTLLVSPSGSAPIITCTLHGLRFDLAGGGLDGAGARLQPLELRLRGELMLVRAARSGRTAAADDPWMEVLLPSTARILGVAQTSIAADWKLIVEQWLGARTAAAATATWSTRAYESIMGPGAAAAWFERVISPNHLIERRPDGVTVLQVLPGIEGHSLLRQLHFTTCAGTRQARAAQYAASRRGCARGASLRMVESVQKAVTFLRQDSAQDAAPAAVTAFRRQLLGLMPVLALHKPPNDF